jgi:hypothetical protein
VSADEEISQHGHAPWRANHHNNLHDIGRRQSSVIATNGVLTALRYITPPAVQVQKYPAYLTLLDDGAVPTITLFNYDFNSYPSPRRIER